jgi:hypothetical protein
MHTHIYEKTPTEPDVVFNYNGDYSGDVIIRKFAVNGEPAGEITVPIAALESFMKGLVGDKLVSLLEANGYA